MQSIDALHVQKRAELFLLCLYLCIAGYNIACFQTESADLRRGHIDIVLPRQVIITADKTKTV